MPTNYLHVNGMKIAQIKDGVRTDYLTDALGSVTATKNQSQQIVNTYRYKPYGKLLARTGLGDDPRYLWTGNTGSRVTQTRNVNQYNVHRHYANGSAVWTSVDPLWPDEWAFGYALQSPTEFTDPFGRGTGKPEVDPCAKFKKKIGPIQSKDTACGRILLPVGISIPPKRGDKDAWKCLLSMLESTGKAQSCLKQMAAILVSHQALLQLLNKLYPKDQNDKKVHCILGCAAENIVSSCCALYLAAWLEVKTNPGLPPGLWDKVPPPNYDDIDFRATLAGVDCNERWKNIFGCRINPKGLITDDILALCRRCCLDKYASGDIPIDPPK